MGATWHLLTAERGGGCARQLARGLAACGESAELWMPGEEDGDSEEDGVRVHALEGGYGLRSLRALARGLDRASGEKRLWLDYAPGAFRAAGTSATLCGFLAARREPLWVMFHEVDARWRRPGQTFGGFATIVHRGLVALLLARASKVFVPTEAWAAALGAHAHGRLDPVVVPCPSPLPCAAAADLSALGVPGGARVVAHLARSAEGADALAEEAVAQVLGADASVHALVLGAAAARLGMRMAARACAGPGRVHGGDGSPAKLAGWLAAADVAIQPFEEGLTARRSEVSAALCLGVPVVSNLGRATEPFWVESTAVALAPCADAVAATVQDVLLSPELRARLAATGRAFYAERLAPERLARLVLAAASG